MVTVGESGNCIFRVYLPNAGRVELLGSFTEWQEAPADMQREIGGWWTLSRRLPPGDHEFCYLVDTRVWMPDYAATGMKRNSSGNWISLLSVSAQPVSGEREAIPGMRAEPRVELADPPPTIEIQRPGAPVNT